MVTNAPCARTIFRMKRALGLLALFVPFAAAPGCADKPATAVVVAVSSEAPIRTDNDPNGLDSLEIRVTRGADERFFKTYVIAGNGVEAQLPGTLTITPSDDPDEPISVAVVARTGGIDRVVRKAKLSFSDEKTKLLRMPIRFSCMDRETPCPEGLTCKAGACTKADVDPEGLPEFTEDKVFPVAGKCFDRVACVNGDAVKGLTVDLTPAFKASPDEVNCAIKVSDISALPPADPTKKASFSAKSLNVGIVWAQNASKKWTAVDFDEEEGWKFADASQETIHLAPGLCAAIKGNVKGAAVGKVIANPACAPKTPILPECPPPPPAAPAP